jgi:ribosomal protein L11
MADILKAGKTVKTNTKIQKNTPMKEAKGKLSPGAKTAAKMREIANKLTDEQRETGMSAAMQVIYGDDKKVGVHAVRH